MMTSQENIFIPSKNITNPNIFYEFLNDQLALGKLSQYILNNSIKNKNDINSVLEHLKYRINHQSPFYSKALTEIEIFYQENKNASLDEIKDLLSKKGIDEKQHYDLYLKVSEKLLSKPMSIGRIKDIYDSEMIYPPTELEFKTLLAKQAQKNNASTSTTNNTNYYKTERIAGKFYQLIYQKMIDRLITVKQYEKLYEEISEQMKSKSFTIEEINQFCENNNIPTFREDELFRIAKKDKNSVDPNSEYIEFFKIIEANTDLTKKNVINENSLVLISALKEFIFYQAIIVEFKNFLKNMINPEENDINVEQTIDINNEFLDTFITYVQIVKNIYPEEESLGKLEKIFEGMKNQLNDEKNTLADSKSGSKPTELAPPTDVDLKEIDSTLSKLKTINPEQYKNLKKFTENFEAENVKAISIKTINKKYKEENMTPPTEEEFQILANSDFFRSRKSYLQKTIKINVNDELMFSIKVFSDEEKMSGLAQNEIEEALTNTLATFNEAFGFIKNNKSSFGRHENKAHFTLHFFKNEKSFYDYTKSKEINLVGYAPNNNIYVYLGGRFQEQLNRTIRHEFVHLFMNYSGVGEVINSFSILSEGIPTYVAGLSKGENAIHFLSDLKNHLDEKNFNKSLTLKNLLSDQFLEDNNLSHYIAGPVVIAYFEDMFPNVIDKLLYDIKDMVEENKEEFLKKIQKLYDEAYSTPFKNWVETHSNEGFHAWLEPAPTKNQDGDGSSAEVTSPSEDALKPEVDSSFQQGDSHQNEAGLLKQGMSQFSSDDATHVPENPVLHSDVIPTVISNAS
ncbi:hypothetical protein GWK90_02145 [Candidatus Hamiltonella defensa]|nr:hypothetical protein [Candidatus Hamiltonella defensa]MBK4361093.1 hypothetical protein [Candidatus Hamiltonella defensa]